MKSNAEIVREKYGIEPGVDDLEDFDSGEILDGIEVEFEHTDDPAEALKIALDHLREIPDYYTRLIAMEADALEKAGGRRDLTKLVRKQIVDKRGHRKTVWVKRGETTAVKEKKSDGQKPLWGPGIYVRRTKNDNPMSDWGHAMFVEGTPDTLGAYGDVVHRFDGKNAMPISDLKEKMEAAYEKYPAFFSEYEDIEDFEDLYHWFDPDDIVDSAEAYDNADFLEWLYTRVLSPNGIEAITTQQGAIVFDPDLIETLGKWNEEDGVIEPISKAETWTGHKLHGRRLFRGLDISIENRAGSYREWAGGRTKMLYPYGYIRRTAGADGDHVDCYIGPDEDAPTVYVVRQLDPETGEFDEDKVFLGFPDEAAAKDAYLQHVNRPEMFGGIEAFPFDEFKEKALATMHKNAGMIKAVPADVDRGGFIGMAVALVKAIGGRKDITKLIKKQITNKKGVRQTVYVKREDAPKETKKSIFDRIAAALNLARVSDVVPEVKAKFAVAGPIFGIDAGAFEDHFLEYWRHKAFWDARFSGRPEKEKAEKKPRAGKKKKARGESGPKAPAKYRADVMRWIAEQYGLGKKTPVAAAKDNFETMPEAVPGGKKTAGRGKVPPFAAVYAESIFLTAGRGAGFKNAAEFTKMVREFFTDKAAWSKKGAAGGPDAGKRAFIESAFDHVFMETGQVRYDWAADTAARLAGVKKDSAQGRDLAAAFLRFNLIESPWRSYPFTPNNDRGVQEWAVFRETPEYAKLQKKKYPSADNFETMPESTPAPGEGKPTGTPEAPVVEKPQFVDVGEHIGGSKKDIRALVRELEADKDKSVSLDDAAALEAEGLAEAFVTRDRQIGTRKNFALSMYRAGAEPAAVALSWWFLSKIDGPAKQTPEARQNFIVACNRLMEAVSLWKTPADAAAGIRAIFEEFHGFLISSEDQKILADKRGEYTRVREVLQDYANDLWKESGYDNRRYNREKEKDPKFNDLYNKMRDAQRDIDNFQKQAKASYEGKNGAPVWKSLGKKFEKEMGRVSYTPDLSIHPKSEFLKKMDDYTKKAMEYDWEKFGIGESGEEIKKEKKKTGEDAEEKPRRWARDVPDEIERESPVKVGKGYDSQKLLDDFGLRGIEYGNYVDKESAKQHTQSCAEAFMDLAHILGVTPKDVSLKGRLAVAFGARGSGNALAHYEAVRKVINITKNRGGGSLAHEWGHALDNILAVVASGGKWGGDKAVTDADFEGKKGVEVFDVVSPRAMAFFTENYGNREEFPGLSPELEAAFADVSRAMEYSELPISRKFKFDVYEKKNKYRKSFYPGSFVRQYVEGAEEAIMNGGYKGEIETRIFDELAGNPDQIKKIIQKKFDELHEKSIKTLSIMKGYYQGENPQLFFDVAGEYHRACLEFVNKFMGMLYNRDRLKPELVGSLKKGTPVLMKTLPVMERDGKQLYESAYFNTAKELGEYWKRPVELFARAFEAYVSDRLDESGMKNSYLSSGNRESDVSKYAAGWQEKTGFQYSVYPRGEDRKRVKAAFDRFFELMKKESVLQKAILLYNQMNLAK